MNDKVRGLRDYSRSLGAGGESVVKVKGNYYHVVSAISPVQLSFNDGAFITREQGVGGSVGDYTEVRVKSVVAQTVTVAFGTGVLNDSRAVVSISIPAGTEINAEIQPATLNEPKALKSIGAGATVLLSAANADRLELRVGVKATEAGGVYIGDVNVAAGTEGGWLELGSIDYLATSAAVYAYNPGAAAVNVNLLEFTRP